VKRAKKGERGQRRRRRRRRRREKQLITPINTRYKDEKKEREGGCKHTRACNRACRIRYATLLRKYRGEGDRGRGRGGGRLLIYKQLSNNAKR